MRTVGYGYGQTVRQKDSPRVKAEKIAILGACSYCRAEPRANGGRDSLCRPCRRKGLNNTDAGLPGKKPRVRRNLHRHGRIFQRAEADCFEGGRLEDLRVMVQEAIRELGQPRRAS